MEFKAIASPPKSKGQKGGRKRQVVPNQAMSLEEILKRFVRNEALPVGREAIYHDGEDDLSKLDDLDPVEKKEYADKQRQIQRDFKEQERVKREKAKAKIEAEERQKVAAKMAEELADKMSASKKAE